MPKESHFFRSKERDNSFITRYEGPLNAMYKVSYNVVDRGVIIENKLKREQMELKKRTVNE